MVLKFSRLFLNPCLLMTSVLLTTAVVQAAPILTVGTPGNSQLATPTGPSPKMGTPITFDALTPLSTFVPNTYASLGVTSISSPDGLIVEPFSTQSYPNELYDNSLSGTADITISLAFGTNAIGIGIADSDPVNLTFQALAANGTALGSPLSVNLAMTESTINTGNGYYIVSDTTNDIFGLRITQTSANVNFSGLAIDDVQVAPEPSTFMLLTAGSLFIGVASRRKRA